MLIKANHIYTYKIKRGKIKISLHVEYATLLPVT